MRCLQIPDMVIVSTSGLSIRVKLGWDFDIGSDRMQLNMIRGWGSVVAVR